MSERLITASLAETLEQAYLKMKKYNIRHLPVVDSERNVVGIISDRDIHRGMESDVRDYSSFRLKDADFDPQAKVVDYMSSPVKTVRYESDLKAIAERMIDEKISSFLITKDDAVVGIVTHEDLLRVLVHLLGQPEKEGLFENLQKWLYKIPVGEIANSLAQAGI